jgi:hypothetical protein
MHWIRKVAFDKGNSFVHLLKLKGKLLSVLVGEWRYHRLTV